MIEYFLMPLSQPTTDAYQSNCVRLYLTDDVTLKFPGEYCVHDAGTLGGLDVGFVDQMSVQQVQGGNEELMGVLLLITS